MIIPRIKPITQKRLDQLKRNSSSKEYREWKLYVLERDNYHCQYPLCGRSKDRGDKLQVHHIVRFANNRLLRTETFNGLTLCEICHRRIHGQEQAYEFMFFKIAKANESRFQKNKNTKGQ